MEPAAPTRPSRAFLLALLLVCAAGVAAVWWAYAGRWRGAEARAFASAALAGDRAALLLFDADPGCALGHAPVMVAVRRTGDGWKVAAFHFSSLPRRGRVAAIDIPHA